MGRLSDRLLGVAYAAYFVPLVVALAVGRCAPLRATVASVASLHFVFGAVKLWHDGACQAVAVAVTERYARPVAAVADLLITAALVTAAAAACGDGVTAAWGFAVAGNAFCLWDHARPV